MVKPMIKAIMPRRIMKKPIGVLQDKASNLIAEVWDSGKVRAWVEVREWLEVMAQDKSNPKIAGLGELIELFEKEFLVV